MVSVLTFRALTMYKGSKQLRKEYAPTIAAKTRLLERFREGCPMTAEERQAVWLCLSDEVYSKAKKHYKSPQPYGPSIAGRAREWFEIDPTHPGWETHLQRIELLVEFIKRRSDKSIGWVISTWKRRFHQFEGLRQLRLIGVKYKEDGSLISEQSAIVRDYIMFSRLSRAIESRGETPTSRLLMSQWLQEQFNSGRNVTQQRLFNAMRKLEEYEFLKNLATPKRMEYYEYSSDQEV